MKTIKILIAAALTAMLASAFMGCSNDGGDSPALPPPHVHTYAAEWTSSETHHWHAATCGHDEKKGFDVHSAAAELGKDATGHWKVCGVCNASFETTSHTWDHEDFQFDVASGKEIKTCTVCGFVADKNHVHTEDSGTVTKAATCTENGVKTYKCTLCAKVLRTEEIPATGHIEDNGTVTTTPTCTEKGLRTYKCTFCDKVLRTEEIPATGHTEDSGTVTTAPTCVTKGVKTYKCSVCKVVLRTEELPELYSSPVDAETGLPATKSSNYIYFGVFPKTVAAKTITVDENVSVTMGANTYYKGKNDENYYVKVKEHAYDTGTGTGTEYKYSDGTQAKQSSSNSYRWFKVEPIKWKVITDSYSGKCLLLAEDILTAYVPYYKYNSLFDARTVGSDTGIYPNNYKYSQIRAYLNGLDYYYDESSTSTVKKNDYTGKGFLQTAFIAEAQNLIAVTTVDNSAASTTDSGNHLDKAGDYACADTEVTSYGFPAYNEYGAGNARIRKSTDYAMANFAYQDSRTGYGGSWMLRSPYYKDYTCERNVSSDGYVGDSVRFSYVHFHEYGVVPALSISLQ